MYNFEIYHSLYFRMRSILSMVRACMGVEKVGRGACEDVLLIFIFWKHSLSLYDS